MKNWRGTPWFSRSRESCWRRLSSISRLPSSRYNAVSRQYPLNVREAAWCSGLSGWQTFWRIELPLAWPGIVSAAVLTIAHTLGEFGVVLMVGGNLAGETRTVAIAIYDRVQAFDNAGAATMSAALLGISLLSITLIYCLTDRAGSNVRR